MFASRSYLLLYRQSLKSWRTWRTENRVTILKNIECWLSSSKKSSVPIRSIVQTTCFTCLHRSEKPGFVSIGAQSAPWGPSPCILPLDAIKLFGARRKSDYPCRSIRMRSLVSRVSVITIWCKFLCTFYVPACRCPSVSVILRMPWLLRTANTTEHPRYYWRILD